MSIVYQYETMYPDVKKIVNEFEKDIFENEFFRNIDILLFEENYTKVPFSKNSWNQNPAEFCFDEYGSGFSPLYNLILLVNNCSNFYEFTFDNLSEVVKPKWSVIQSFVNTKII
jgi:hypothetical protein